MSFKINSKMPSSNVSYIHSEKIRPIQINDTRDGTGSCHFVFRNIGTLDMDTSIRIPVTSTSTANRFLPINIGIGAVIKSATLRSNGGVVILQNHNYPVWSNIHNSMTDVSKKKRVLTGKHGFIGTTFKPSRAGDLNDNAKPLGQIALDLENAYTAINAAGLGEQSGDLDTAGSSYLNYLVTDNTGTTLQAVVSLHDLFPYARNIVSGLPLDLIQDEVSLVLEFTRNDTGNRTSRLCAKSTQTAGDYYCDIDTSNVEMLVDYIIYKDQSATSKEIFSPNGKMIHYSDLNWAQYNMPGMAATGAPPARNRKTYSFNLSLTNASLRQMYCALSPAPSANLQQNAGSGNNQRHYTTKHPVFGLYSSVHPSAMEDGFRMNLRVNQQLVYQEHLENPAQFITELEDAYGNKLHMPQATYDHLTVAAYEGSAEELGAKNFSRGDISDHSKIMGWQQSSVLTGCNFLLGFNFEKSMLLPDGSYIRRSIPGSGLKIGESPIILDMEVLYQNNNNDARNLDVCCVVEKTLIIKNGQLMVLQ